MKAIGIIASPMKKGSTVLPDGEMLRGLRNSGAGTKEHVSNESFGHSLHTNQAVLTQAGSNIENTIVAGGLRESEDLPNQSVMIQKACNAGMALASS